MGMTIRLLTRGATGVEVVDIVYRLKKLGHFHNEVTSTYSAEVEKAVTYFQMVSLGKDGSPLSVDGRVGKSTLWALKHATGVSQKSNLDASMPKGVGGKREQVLLTALQEHMLGAKESPNGSNRGKLVDKYYPKFMRSKFVGKDGGGAAWCAFFFNWCVTQTMNLPWDGYFGSCYSLWKKSNDLGLAYRAGERMPRPGDAFLIFKPSPMDGGHPKSGHVGLVLRVNKEGTVINTVEGNCGNRVKVGRREVKDIACFIDYINDGLDYGGEKLLSSASAASDDTR
jgi:hypothetical protein